MESILWDNAEKEEGIFLEGGNPKRVGPIGRELSRVEKEGKAAIVTHAYNY